MYDNELNIIEADFKHSKFSSFFNIHGYVISQYPWFYPYLTSFVSDNWNIVMKC